MVMSPGNQTQRWSQPRGTHLPQSYKNWLQLNAAPMGMGQCGLGRASMAGGSSATPIPETGVPGALGASCPREEG